MDIPLKHTSRLGGGDVRVFPPGGALEDPAGRLDFDWCEGDLL
ncbi:hypothetical protein ACIQU4_00865 [Streptomyces sp. NPDC090741]